ncbi:MAG: hypothetical protein ACI89X_000559 [Planctomycetota bacterium]|jgi:hypothetical protein
MATTSMTGEDAERPQRLRRWVVVALVCTIALGLLSRRYPLPGILAEYAGDALYTSAGFAGLALLFAGAKTRSLAIAAFVLSAAVEFAQLLSWPWINELRATLFGRLVLGSGFKWPDIVAYLIGAMAASAVDFALARHHVCKA